jgi:sugar phosphate isomerase/epimerase
VIDHRFGMSTHLFHQHRLAREHIAAIASHGFEAIELFAARSHFDYHDVEAIGALAGWLQEAAIELHSVHAPIVEEVIDGSTASTLSTASGDQRRRGVAVQAACAALDVAQRIPFGFLVVHLGVVSDDGFLNDNRPDAARRSLVEIAEAASKVGVRVAAEVIPNKLSEPAALVQLIEDELDDVDVGICLDYGHAHIMGDLDDAIEAVSGHLCTTHVHDNRGRWDEHLTPFAGTISWNTAMMETLKIGYDGMLMLELAGGADPGEVLRRSMKARERLARTLVMF